MTLHSPSRTSTASLSRLRAYSRLHTVRLNTPPVSFLSPSTHQTWGVHFPADPQPWCSRTVAASLPRHGFPNPLRSAFAVFRDLGGLLLPRLCSVFQPLTPMGFASPVSPNAITLFLVLEPRTQQRGVDPSLRPNHCRAASSVAQKTRNSLTEVQIKTKPRSIPIGAGTRARSSRLHCFE